MCGAVYLRPGKLTVIEGKDFEVVESLAVS